MPWTSFQQYVRTAWDASLRGQPGGWEAALQQGGVWREAPAAVAVTAKAATPDVARPALEGDASAPVLLAYPSLRFYDGRSSGSAWLHEVPDPMTQDVWDAWVEVPAATAKSLGVSNGDVVKVTSPHGAVELPPGVRAHASESNTLEIGIRPPAGVLVP